MPFQFLIQILERVRTFQITQWRYQDQNLFSPYKLASIGYKVIKKNTIECDTCHHYVEFLEEDDDNPAKHEAQIMNHKQHCIYLNEKAKGISKQELYLRMDEIMASFDQENKKNESKLYPILNSKSIETIVGLDASILNKILKSYDINPREFKISFFLQLFGWYSSTEQGKQHLSCYFCGRDVLKSDYLSVGVDKQDPAQENNEKAFDPIKEHRYFCIWVSRQTRGWLIYLQHLYDKLNQLVGYKLRSNPNETKKMRIQIDRYIEVFQAKTSEQLAKINHIFQQCEKLNNIITSDPNLRSQQQNLDLQEENRKINSRRQQAAELIRELNEFSSQGLKRVKID